MNLSPSSAAPVSSGRLAFVDALRALAAQLVLWHHLASYGPLGEALWQLAPALWGFLYSYARMAVQIFLVVGGLMSARGFAGERAPQPRNAPALLGRRVLRLWPPYAAAIGLALAASAFARRSMVDEAIPAPPTWDGLLAHVLFLQDLLGYEGLSAGLWYVAIDFQLFALVLLVFALSSLAGRLLEPRGVSGLAVAQGVFSALAVASLFWFNREPGLDAWGLYFFAAYFLGMALGWSLAGSAPRWLFWGYAALVGASLAVEWRPRLLVALGAALVLWGASRLGMLEKWPKSRLLGWLGRTSYSLFLVHFPVCLAVNAAFVRWAPGWPVAGIACAVLLSLAAGALFHWSVERRCAGRRTAGAPESEAAPAG